MEIMRNGMLGLHICGGCDSSVRLAKEDIKTDKFIGLSSAYWECPICETKNELVR